MAKQMVPIESDDFGENGEYGFEDRPLLSVNKCHAVAIARAGSLLQVDSVSFISFLLLSKRITMTESL